MHPIRNGTNRVSGNTAVMQHDYHERRLFAYYAANALMFRTPPRGATQRSMRCIRISLPYWLATEPETYSGWREESTMRTDQEPPIKWWMGMALVLIPLAADQAIVPVTKGSYSRSRSASHEHLSYSSEQSALRHRHLRQSELAM